MKVVYDIGIAFAKALLPLIALFNKKLQLGSNGREQTWTILDEKVKTALPKIWVHAASLGEYEQVVPVLEKLDRKHNQVILTFFSPSGYENKKHTKLADIVCYLPLDSVANVEKFLDHVQPSLAIMVKYEFWPNYLFELDRRDVKTILVSGIFRKNMAFNKWYGLWMKPSLQAISHFFLQNESSLKQLKKLGFTNATVTGDTRFDRASKLIEQDASIPFLDQFLEGKKCLVLGSSWPEDIAIMKQWLKENDKSQTYKIIIVPHEIDDSSIKSLESQLGYKSLKWSTINDSDSNLYVNYSTLIVNTIGLLTKIYSYASVAYVGGAMGKKGLHNILEAATYGVPVVIGKNYKKFPEAGKLEDLGGLFSVSSQADFEQTMNKLLTDDMLRDKTGMICEHWINSNTGATREIVEYLKLYNAYFITD